MKEIGTKEDVKELVDKFKDSSLKPRFRIVRCMTDGVVISLPNACLGEAVNKAYLMSKMWHQDCIHSQDYIHIQIQLNKGESYKTGHDFDDWKTIAIYQNGEEL